MRRKWKDKIQQDNSKLKVGLVWQGNPKHKNDMNRSVPFSYFSALAQLSDITFYSLQKGKASEQSKNLPLGMQFVDLTEEINDFSDTAALIENLDLKEEVPVEYQVKAGHGIAALEVPRGTVYHEYELDDKGFVTKANIISPTTQNLFNIEEDYKADWNIPE